MFKKIKNVRIDIWSDPRTLVAQELAYNGMTQKTIARVSGLTDGQTMYRLKKLGVSTVSYRHGDSDIARNLILRLYKKYNLTYRYRKEQGNGQAIFRSIRSGSRT